MKVLVIEGQGNLGFVRRQLVLPFLAKHPGAFEPVYAAWDDFALDSQIKGVIGHSLGAHRAIQAAGDLKPNWLITLDPRWMSNASFLDSLFPLPWVEKFKAPIARTFNFTHSPPFGLPGYQVVGAENKALFSTHLSIPGHAAVRECLERLVLG